MGEQRPFPTFAHWLKTAREERGLTQADLARRMEYEVSLIRKVESGQRQPSAEFRHRLALALTLPPEAIPNPNLLTVTNVHIPQDNDRLPAPGPLFAGSYLPLAANPLFTGRADLLHRLARAFTTRQTVCLGQVAVATGLGGIGKTQLAVEFAHRYGRFFPGGVFWLNFADPNAIPAEIARCGHAAHLNLSPDFDRLPQERQVALVQRAWQEATPRLLIFDNCEEESLLAHWRPTTGGCHVLVTSRCQQWDLSLGVAHLLLDVLPRPESVTLLGHFRPDLAPQTANALAETLGDLPLALHVAGSYLALDEAALDPADYLEQLQQHGRLRHPSLQTGRFSPTRHDSHLSRTFALSIVRLDTSQPVEALALALLARAACFAPGEPIPPDLLAATAPDDQPIDAALTRLAQLGLVTVGVGGSIRLHQLITEFVQATLVNDGVATAVYQALLHLTEQGNVARDLYPARHWQVHLRHITIAAQARADALSADLAQALGKHLWLCSDYQEASTFLEAALVLRRQLLGKSHLDVATTLDSLGRTWQSLNRREQARACLEEALAIRRQAFGDRHLLTAESHTSLGLVYQVLSDFPAARFHLEMAMAIRRQQLGMSHPDTGFVAHCLCMQSNMEGRYAEGIEWGQIALKIARDTYGPDHPDIARSLNMLGLIYFYMDAYQPSRRYFQEALELRRRLLGENHNDTITTLNNLGNVLYKMGLWADARPLLEEAFALRQTQYGPDHPTTAQSLQSVAALLFESGNDAAAQPLLEQSLTRYEVAMGPEHAFTAFPLLTLGRLHHRAGNWTLALRYLQRALAIRLAQLGEQHELTAVTLTCLGDLHTDTGEWTTAAEHLARARHTLTRPDANKLVLAQNSHAYGRFCQAQDDLVTAHNYFAEALALRQQYLGPDHPDTRQSEQALAGLRHLPLATTTSGHH
jgi:tetratricopeptide (TPR) repeat protein/transcriptional regulator with XRE-family HTH domain